MPFSLIPHRVLDCYTQVTPQMLGSLGIQLLLCDLDYTLAPKSVPRPDKTLRAWLADCQTAGITVMILSNNRSSRGWRPSAATWGSPMWATRANPGAGLPGGYGALRYFSGAYGNAGR